MMFTNILLGCICGSLIAIAASLARLADELEEIKRGGKE